MKILLDTNIIMDALQERQPYDTVAKEILSRSQSGDVKCSFTANAATDIFYIYSKARDMSSARNVLNYLLANFEVITVTHRDCTNAMSLPIEDFEDALVVICGIKAGMDYIVTRDEEFLQVESLIPLISPDKILEKF